MSSQGLASYCTLATKTLGKKIQRHTVNNVTDVRKLQVQLHVYLLPQSVVPEHTRMPIALHYWRAATSNIFTSSAGAFHDEGSE